MAKQIFMKFYTGSFTKNVSTHYQFWLKWTTITGTLHKSYMCFCTQKWLGRGNPQATLVTKFTLATMVTLGITSQSHNHMEISSMMIPSLKQAPLPCITDWPQTTLGSLEPLQRKKVRFLWMCQNCFAIHTFPNLFKTFVIVKSVTATCVSIQWLLMSNWASQ
jgi:hypothetical protein